MRRTLSSLETLGLGALLRRDRETAYRRALKRVGFMPHSVDVIVEKDREWIERGK